MPAVPSGSKILVTGASGFVAIHVVAELLKEGFQVVGTVRSADKGEYLVKQFAGKPFSYTIVEDVQDQGAFAESVKDVAGVLHTASPFYVAKDGADPQELIGPAVKGTVGILEAAKDSKTIQRVVVTSSVAAIIIPKDAPYTFTEDDWNTDSTHKVETKGKDAGGADKYSASKTYAEQAAWKFVKEHSAQWDLATVNPPYVFGPPDQEVASADKLNTSVAMFWGIATGNLKESDLPGPGGNWVDVRDVAMAHVKALTTPEAGGQRFIVSAGPWCKQDITDALNKLHPELTNVPKGKAGAAKEANSPDKALVHSGKKAEKVLGIRYHTIEESVRDMYSVIKSKGF